MIRMCTIFTSLYFQEPDGTIILPEDDDEYRPKPKKIIRDNYFGAPESRMSNLINYRSKP